MSTPVSHGSASSRRSPPRTEADPTRDLAFDILCGVVEHRRMLETTLDRSTTSDPRDRASAHRLAATVLRYMGSMTELLQPLLRREPPAPVRCALLMGVAQLRHLGTPPHAAVGTIVSLLRRRGLTPFAGLANAVLRRVAREGDTLAEGLDQDRLDVPPWLWSAWGGRARAIASGMHREAPLDLTLRPGAEVPDGGVVMPNGSVRFPAGTRVTEIPGFEEGAFWVQDAAASMPARLLNAQPGWHVIDLCAAPGGKTAQLALAGAQVSAVERDAGRMRRMSENLERLRIAGVEEIVADALQWKPASPANAVLLDAPCSATGTLRRHPDVLWVKRPRDVTALAQGQDALIDAAANMLAPGGILLYAVCSLQDEEGAARVEAALTRGWELLPFAEDEFQGMPIARTREGYFRTHPGMWHDEGGMDGFFAARLRRKS
ncbi:RsmB/NOP family class I SAM-dependent RNA methyltransferase [Brytella acorum]|uniref:RsmB/NOP family class I SAM-dependent RNA methyltransferase n=1 Tax=Brytella acorum TaxID=2959299 RepID=UPI0025AE1744|nr:transcription antitermination factor NusB [Brytella acorum]MDF3624052.1 transcription antitermination factor NusB [Brytella acorum]